MRWRGYEENEIRDFVTILKPYVGTVLERTPEEYQKYLAEHAFAEVSADDARYFAVLAMKANQAAVRARAAEQRDNWLYENFPLYRAAVDAGGSGFVIRPGRQFEGTEFTGSWISPEFVKYSKKRPQGKNESDASYKKYLAKRQQALENASGISSEEVASQLARQTGEDAMELEEQLIDFFRDLKKQELYHKYKEFRDQENYATAEQMRRDREEFMQQEQFRIENEAVRLLEAGQPLTMEQRSEIPAGQRLAAIDRHQRAGQRSAAQQPSDAAGQVGGFHPAAQRQLRYRALHSAVRQFGGREHRPGRHGVEADAVIVPSQSQHVLPQSAAAGQIGVERRRGAQHRLIEHRHRRLRRAFLRPMAQQFHGGEVVDSVQFGVESRIAPGVAVPVKRCVEHQTLTVAGRPAKLGQLRVVAQIGDDQPMPGSGQLPQEFPSRRGVGAGVQDHSGAARCQITHDHFSDPPVSAGDQNAAAVQIHNFTPPWCGR